MFLILRTSYTMMIEKPLSYNDKKKALTCNDERKTFSSDDKKTFEEEKLMKKRKFEDLKTIKIKSLRDHKNQKPPRP